MARCRIAPIAESDLEQIWNYIARDNVDAADRMLDRIGDVFEMLSRQPLIGESRSEIRVGLRSFPVGNYVVYYALASDRVDIARVLHGARDVDAIF
jgi:toxin ParE1/3/4